MGTLNRALERVGMEARRYATGSDRRAIRSELAREAFFRVAARFTPAIEAEWPSGRFVVSTADRDVSRVTFMRGPFGLHTLESAVGLIERERSRDLTGLDVLDIGANIGTTTVPLVTRFGAAHVHAFEPAPLNWRRLAQNIAGNGLEGRATAHRLAVSDHVGSVEFAVSGRNAGSSHVAAPGETGTLVECASIDSLVARGIIEPDRVGLVWIDVEGHEAAVLAGAASLDGVPFVIEYQPRLHPDLDRLHAQLADRFRRVFDLGSRTEVSVASLSRRGPGFATDLLLL